MAFKSGETHTLDGCPLRGALEGCQRKEGWPCVPGPVTQKGSAEQAQMVKHCIRMDFNSTLCGTCWMDSPTQAEVLGMVDLAFEVLLTHHEASSSLSITFLLASS